MLSLHEKKLRRDKGKEFEKKQREKLRQGYNRNKIIKGPSQNKIKDFIKGEIADIVFGNLKRRKAYTKPKLGWEWRRPRTIKGADGFDFFVLAGEPSEQEVTKEIHELAEQYIRSDRKVTVLPPDIGRGRKKEYKFNYNSKEFVVSMNESVKEKEDAKQGYDDRKSDLREGERILEERPKKIIDDLEETENEILKEISKEEYKRLKQKSLERSDENKFYEEVNNGIRTKCDESLEEENKSTKLPIY